MEGREEGEVEVEFWEVGVWSVVGVRVMMICSPLFA